MLLNVVAALAGGALVAGITNSITPRKRYETVKTSSGQFVGITLEGEDVEQYVDALTKEFGRQAYYAHGDTMVSFHKQEVEKDYMVFVKRVKSATGLKVSKVDINWTPEVRSNFYNSETLCRITLDSTVITKITMLVEI